MKIIKEAISNNAQKLENFMQKHYYGLPEVPLKNCSIEELKQMKTIAYKLWYQAEKNGDSEQNRLWRHYKLLSAAIKQNKPNYDLVSQIEKDIWNTIGIDNQVDYDALRALYSKYRDNKSLFYSIRNRILNRERWTSD